MNTIENFREQFAKVNFQNGQLGAIGQKAFDEFNKLGVPTAKHEEWKYTRIGGLFNKEFVFTPGAETALTANEIDHLRLPGNEEANELVFVNGSYSSKLSNIRSADLIVLPLEQAVEQFSDIVLKHLGHSSKYVKDGIHAMNTAFIRGGVYIHIKAGQITEHPVYIYNISDVRSSNSFSQPRSLVYIGENAQVQITENFSTIGNAESFTNQVLELVVEKDAMVEYYKIQNDHIRASQVSTTHFRQIGKSYIHTVCISLNGDIVRNNLSIAMESANAEAHLHGLYFLKGDTHVDNHTVVDNVMPGCQSNELYKGIIDVRATAVFNGKIFVQRDAQKTNAFQSNKNILLSENASVNTKPQLEIFADDVKCSHGCTIGRLNEEGMFYLRSRGISEKMARSLLVQAFAIDILEHIKPEVIRKYVDQLVSERLEFNIV